MSRLIDKIIIHCADTYSDQDIDAAEIDRWHKERGWSQIGYHFVIKRDGEVEKGRPIEKQGAHTLGHNRNSIGICLVGGKPRYNFRKVQMASLRNLVSGLKRDHPSAKVHGHNEFADKECPTFDVRVWAEDELF